MKKRLLLAMMVLNLSLFAATNSGEMSKITTIFQNAVSYESNKIGSYNYNIAYDSNKKVIGYFVSLQANGVEDMIEFDLGIDTKGKIVKLTNVDIGQNEKRKNKIVLDQKWQNSWIGRDKSYRYDSKVDGMAGASISPRVMFNSMKTALENISKIGK